jgi:hypothetical protein
MHGIDQAAILHVFVTYGRSVYSSGWFLVANSTAFVSNYHLQEDCQLSAIHLLNSSHHFILFSSRFRLPLCKLSLSGLFGSKAQQYLNCLSDAPS